MCFVHFTLYFTFDAVYDLLVSCRLFARLVMCDCTTFHVTLMMTAAITIISTFTVIITLVVIMIIAKLIPPKPHELCHMVRSDRVV